jgi:hypothetical protein
MIYALVAAVAAFLHWRKPMSIVYPAQAPVVAPSPAPVADTPTPASHALKIRLHLRSMSDLDDKFHTLVSEAEADGLRVEHSIVSTAERFAVKVFAEI